MSCLPKHEDQQALLSRLAVRVFTSCHDAQTLASCLRQVIGEENPEIAMAMGLGYNANRLAKAERDYNMQVIVANIARSGMQPIEYLLR